MFQFVLEYFSEKSCLDQNGILFVQIASLFGLSKDFVKETYQTTRNLSASVKAFEEKKPNYASVQALNRRSSHNVHQIQPVILDHRPFVLPTLPSTFSLPELHPKYGISEQITGSNICSCTHPHGNIDDNGLIQKPLPDKLSSHYSAARDPLALDPSKKASAVQSYFTDKVFDGDITQSVHRMVKDYEICAKQIRLSLKQKTIFFINIF